MILQPVKLRGKDLPGAINVLPAGLGDVLKKRESREFHSEVILWHLRYTGCLILQHLFNKQKSTLISSRVIFSSNPASIIPGFLKVVHSQSPDICSSFEKFTLPTSLPLQSSGCKSSKTLAHSSLCDGLLFWVVYPPPAGRATLTSGWKSLMWPHTGTANRAQWDLEHESFQEDIE